MWLKSHLLSMLLFTPQVSLIQTFKQCFTFQQDKIPACRIRDAMKCSKHSHVQEDKYVQLKKTGPLECISQNT